MLHECILLRKVYIDAQFYPWEKPTKQELKINENHKCRPELFRVDAKGYPATPKLPFDPFNTDSTQRKFTSVIQLVDIL